MTNSNLTECLRNARLVTSGGKVEYKKQAYSNTAVDMDWARKHRLDIDSHPISWFDAFIHIKDNKEKNGFSIEKLLSWTNLRACLNNAALGGKYSDFQNFTVDELMQHIGLYSSKVYPLLQKSK